MDASPETYPAAALDRAARIVTAFVWILAVGLAVAGAFALGAGATPTGAILLAVGVSLAVLHVYLRRLEPRSYVVEDGTLSVLRRSASPRRFVGTFANVHRGALGMRVAGDGGGYGYLGRFRAEGRTVSAYVTDRAQVVLLDVGGSALAVSPADPESFIEKVGRGS